MAGKVGSPPRYTASPARSPSSIDSSVDFYLASGVPRNKLGPRHRLLRRVLARRHRSAPDDRGGRGHHRAATTRFSYHNIVTQYYAAARYHYDAIAEMPWLGSASTFGPANCNFVSYENAQSVSAKGDYVNRNGLGGTIIWTIGQGYVPEQAGQENALLEAVSAAFRPTN